MSQLVRLEGVHTAQTAHCALMDKYLDTRVFFDVLGLEAAARLLELAYAAEKYQVSAIRSGAWYI